MFSVTGESRINKGQMQTNNSYIIKNNSPYSLFLNIGTRIKTTLKIQIKHWATH